MTALPGATRPLVVVPRWYAGPVVGEPGLTLDGQLLRHVRAWSRATPRTSGRAILASDEAKFITKVSGGLE